MKRKNGLLKRLIRNLDYFFYVAGILLIFGGFFNLLNWSFSIFKPPFFLVLGNVALWCVFSVRVIAQKLAPQLSSEIMPWVDFILFFIVLMPWFSLQFLITLIILEKLRMFVMLIGIAIWFICLFVVNKFWYEPILENRDMFTVLPKAPLIENEELP